jgi:excisionase family DNA binding protein
MTEIEYQGTWDIYQAAAYVGFAPGTMRNKIWRREVPFLKLGRSVRFLKRDLDEWLDQHRVDPKS